MKIVIIPDSFKATMQSSEAGLIIERAAKSVFEGCEIARFSIGDGGEGTLSAFSGKRQSALVTSANFEKKEASYIVLGDDCAVIELAECAGLPYSNPSKTTTFGVGELILHAIKGGAKRIIIALGGSSTHDCAAGLVAALGVKFFDKTKASFIPTGESLKDICSIDRSELKINCKDISFEALCDVENYLCKEQGAAFVFAPQKGADAECVMKLEQGSLHFAKVIERELKINVLALKGGGAAGGAGAGVAAFLGCELKKGMDIILNLCGFNDALINADLVITGEGSFDRQSLMGKAVGTIAARAKKANVPVAVIAGRYADFSRDELNKAGIFWLEKTTAQTNLEIIKKNCQKDLYDAAIKMLQAIKG